MACTAEPWPVGQQRHLQQFGTAPRLFQSALLELSFAVGLLLTGARWLWLLTRASWSWLCWLRQVPRPFKPLKMDQMPALASEFTLRYLKDDSRNANVEHVLLLGPKVRAAQRQAGGEWADESGGSGTRAAPHARHANPQGDVQVPVHQPTRAAHADSPLVMHLHHD